MGLPTARARLRDPPLFVPLPLPCDGLACACRKYGVCPSNRCATEGSGVVVVARAPSAVRVQGCKARPRSRLRLALTSATRCRHTAPPDPPGPNQRRDPVEFVGSLVAPAGSPARSETSPVEREGSVVASLRERFPMASAKMQHRLREAWSRRLALLACASKALGTDPGRAPPADAGIPSWPRDKT